MVAVSRCAPRDVRYGLLKEIKFSRRRLRYGADAVRAYLAGFRRP